MSAGAHTLPSLSQQLDVCGFAENVTVTGCTDGNIHTFGAGPAVEIKNVDSSGSNRGFWSMRPSAKLLITDSYFHHNSADGIDLDSLSEHVMIRRNRLENNGRAGVFIEEGASMNIVVDNHFFNNTCESHHHLSCSTLLRR